ncbi:amidohydrolase family protein [Agromyces sp. NPDC055520]
MTRLLDTHVHVWDPTRFDYPWLSGLPTVDRPFLPADIDRADGATARMVFVEADCAPAFALDEVQWVAGFGDAWPELAGIVAAADLRAPDLAARLDVLTSNGPVVGVRHQLQSERASDFADPELVAGLRLTAERGLTFDACVTHDQLPELVTLLGAVPDLDVVLDHLGKPPVDDGIVSAAGRAWGAAIERLAELPRVRVKLSGLAAEASDRTLFDVNADAFIAHAVAVFGVDRAMIGSDWPVSAELGVGGTLKAWLDRLRRVTGATGDEWSALEFRTGSRFYGLDGSAE